MAFKPLSCVCGSLFIPQRYMMVVMMQLALLNAYHLRVVYNIAIVEMITRPSEEGDNQNDTGYVDACPMYTLERVVKGKETQFDWDHTMEAMTLYAFYVGYIVSHVPGGFLADKFGARPVMGTCMAMSVLVTFLFPFGITVIDRGDIMAVILRMILGFVQGPLFPCISALIQTWVPKKERGFLGGLAFGGSNLGTVTGSTLTGIMIKGTETWSVPFYVWAVMASIWCVFYMFIIFSSPKTHPFITEQERELLGKEIEERKRFKVPWFKILTGGPFWALFAAQFAHNFIFFTLVTDLPKYLKEILKMNVRDNAIYTALPFFFLWLALTGFAFLADIITNHNWLSIGNARKVFTTFATMVPATLVILVGYVGCHRELAITLYVLAITCLGPFFSGMKINVNDLTIHYSGTIMAFINGFGALAGVVGPFIVGAFTYDRSIESWQLVFWIMMGVSIAGTIIYDVFASGERQSWDYPQEEAP